MHIAICLYSMLDYFIYFILFHYFIIGFIAHTKLQIIGTRVGNEVNIVWLRVYRLSLPIA